MSITKKKTRITKLAENATKTISWEKILEEFLLFKKAEGRSPRTLKDYGYHVKLFFKRYPEMFLSDADELKRNVIEYMAEDVKPAYYNNKLIYLKIFFEWSIKRNFLMIIH
ncbi:hypothetical protein N752_29920 [Desulforamulus aquiferis]|nr:hypothetical protein [Desulforamulus aquiferis]RYD01521.1 hypothetical protein N752_29920 [Desulforamulus aquiferis]